MRLSFARSMPARPNRRRRNPASRRQRNLLRALESLEERALLAAITVTNSDPGGPGSLAAAIAIANDPISNPGHDTINFAGGVRGPIALDGELVITDDLTIQGPGAGKLTISGEGGNRIFSVLSSDLANPISVEIQKVTIANGVATDAPGFPSDSGFAFGGGLYNLGSIVSLDRVRMQNNQAGPNGLAAGGAIANEFGGSLLITRSDFVDNFATGFVVAAGGAITSDIGPSLNPDGTPGDGTPGQPVVTISHSTFEGNAAHAMVADPVAAGPFAPFAGFAFGGALSNLAGDTTVSHSRFVNNQVVGGEGSADQPGGLANGGAIYSDDFSPFDAVPPLLGRDSSLQVTHSKFVGNGSTGGKGGGADAGETGAQGGVAAGGAISVSISFVDDSANIRHSTFRHNTATGGEGGADGGTGGPALGGALSVLAGAEVAVANSHFSGNVAQGGTGATGGDGGDGTGGAIGLGRIVTAVPTPLEFLVPSIRVNGSKISGNSAIGGSGGDGADGGDGNGGAIGVTAGLIDGTMAHVSRSLLTRNHAVGGSGGVGGDGGNGQGGGVFNSGSDTSLARSLVFRNYAEAGDAGEGGTDGRGLGGGLYNEDDGDLLGTLSVDRLTRMLTRFNHADDDGDNVFGDLS